MKEEFLVSTDAYAGPFPVLLDLVKARKRSIHDIPLRTVAADFLNYIELHSSYPRSVVQSFVRVATELLLIKTLSLQPQQNHIVEEDVLRNELLEYEKLRVISDDLAKRCYVRSVRVMLSSKAQTLKLVTGDHLQSAFMAIKSRHDIKPLLPKVAIDHQVSLKEVMEQIEFRLSEEIEFSLEPKQVSKAEMLPLFLAVLELAKQESVMVTQSLPHGRITIERNSVQVPRYGS